MTAYILFFQVCMYTGELQGKCYQVGPIRAQDEASCKDEAWDQAKAWWRQGAILSNVECIPRGETRWPRYGRTLP